MNLVMIRGGHHLGDKQFLPAQRRRRGARTRCSRLSAQHYLRARHPALIVVGAQLDAAPAGGGLAEQAGRKVRITIESHRRAARVARHGGWKNAQLGAEQAAQPASTQETRLAALAAGARAWPNRFSASSAST